MSQSFSSPYTSSAIMCFMASVQCIVVAAAVERRRLSAWALGWNIRLAASLYIVSLLRTPIDCSLKSGRDLAYKCCASTSQGLVGSGLAFALMSWCLQKRGPLFVSMFSPLLLVVVAVLGWAILDEKLYVGR